MGLDRKLDIWVAAGLIDAAAAARIRAHEADDSRPVALWAVAALGLFAIGLGLILIVSANWDRIADAVKLAVHLLLLAGALVATFVAHRRDRVWAAEGALFLSAVLVLAGILLLSQVYALNGAWWEAGLHWLLVTSPALLLLGRTRLTGGLWAAALLATLFGVAADRGTMPVDLLLGGVALATPYLLLLLCLRGTGQRAGLGEGFARVLGEIAVPLILLAASLAHLVWARALSAGDARDWGWRFVLPLLMAAAVWLFGRRGPVPPRLLLALLLGPLAAGFATLAVPHADGWASRLAGVLTFMLMWGWIAREASVARRATLFGVAIAAIAVRIFLIYVELFGSLASTGLGLAGGGLLLLLLAWGWRRMVRR